ncbi:hypothetical protein J8273_6781 [Carpediemonas membranifera]|uniref:Reverse transcriptase RNase H-like domain-containing protein n=1 Tax=Carpediemonas membranifera TaxID=201153 RepID=A0A8J6ARA0_9EUKA|nr:hypothetical protein J8273_6781 [Carpediemonas membranifera]|eukprot:KAG9391933.1 hypothetical protein J8273_6781 [Carpediemonas membranifera]
MASLGVIPSLKKSQLTPTRSIEYLGVVLDTSTDSMRLSEDKSAHYRQHLQEALVQGRLRARDWANLLGKLAFFSSTAHAALLRLRPLQAVKPSDYITVTTELRALLEPWDEVLRQRPSRPFAELRSLWGMQGDLQVTVATDASGQGWGASLYQGAASRTAQGHFPRDVQDSNICVKELYAIWQGVLMVPAQRGNANLTVFTDNTAAKSWVNRQGLTRAGPVS